MTDELEHKGWVALEYLRQTDEEHAALQLEASRAEHRYKKTCDVQFLALEGAVEQRKTAARVAAEPIYGEYMDTQAKADAMKNKRDTAQLTIDYIRTIMANRRQG